MDWNWFFSALAQCNAAIVGLIGAFIFTKIVSNQTDFSRAKEEFKGLITEADNFRNLANNRYFEWYNKRSLESGLVAVDSYLKLNPKEKDPGVIYREIGFSYFIPKTEVLGHVKERIDNFSPKSRSDSLMMAPSIPTSSSLQNAIQDEREKIDSLISAIQFHQAKIADFQALIRANPFSASLISYTLPLLVSLFFLGIIYPLSFMPYPVGFPIVLSLGAFWEILFSFKGVILGISSVIFLAVVFLLFQINRSLCFQNEELLELDQRVSLGWYSDYLQTLEDNIQADNERLPEKDITAKKA